MHDYADSIIHTVLPDGLGFIPPEHFRLSDGILKDIERSEYLFYNHYQVEKEVGSQWDKPEYAEENSRLLLKIARALKKSVGDGVRVELFDETYIRDSPRLIIGE